MNTPNPLMPQGSLHQHQSRGNSTVRIAVFAVVALHAVFFAGLLMQGCRPDGSESNGKLSSSGTNELAQLESNYFRAFNELPQVAVSPPPETNEAPVRPAPAPLMTSEQPDAPLVGTNQPAARIPAVQPETVAPQDMKEHVVVRGDSLYKIARQHGVKLNAVVEANPDINPSLIRPGQKIKIPAPVPDAAGGAGFREPGGVEGAENVYVIRAGDNLSRIARLKQTTVAALREANNLQTDRILAGQKLIIPVSDSSSAATNPASGSDRANP